ncbi:GNAT family N-acetyltransferase [Cohnella sp. CFH 77786]|uniref:GNAT family N-acetyltransferase n=1 Tax=Cohnella sp. CFH 77786 TaxID=2662265 RepID=UPI001C60DCDF|nr:GNAT family N-acetyltransferase [Cohnella sp. CFH 77786]MBW5445794.1 GNAT family N-acetyltransferase [Cohnella sp. CFH 77786]
MIRYSKGTEAGMDLLYQAFTDGFSDYMLKMEISRDLFEKRFFGPEGNRLEHTFLAQAGGKPVGVVLGGVKGYEGIKTMRCGALAVHPEFRRDGVGRRLMELHQEEAVRLGCGQLFLEVIAGNDRAIDFYTKLGYEKVYDLEYFTLADVSLPDPGHTGPAIIKPAGILDFQAIRRRLSEVHVSWQNDVDYIEQSEGIVLYGAYSMDRLVGLICLHLTGRIKFLWVDEPVRRQGIGIGLLRKAASELGLSKLHLNMAGNASLRDFAINRGFRQDALSQVEMYKRLAEN